MSKFEIRDINAITGVEDGLFGTVVFSFDDGLDGVEVTHHVMTKVRVKVASDAPVRDMRETLYQKAVEQLSRALQVAEGKTAQQLISEALEEDEREQWEHD